MTQTGTSIGTPAYMAPEQAAGDPRTDHRADIYAWGVVAWELLAGKHPFAARTTPQALLAAQLSEVPAALAATRPDVPASLDALVARCLEKDPALRPASAAELLAELDQAGTAVGATRSSARARHFPLRATVGLVAGAAIVALGAWVATHRSPAASAGAKSLAVLPFESVGGDTANAYFAEGMADELTTALSKVGGLRVAATSSAFTYRNKVADVREVGKALSVAAVLQGRVRRAGSRMRVTAQLTSATDGIVLWSNTYEREVKDVFAVQDELTRDIVGALRVTLAGGAPATVAGGAKGTNDLEAYDLYLRGLFFLSQRGGGVTRSIDYFRQAIGRDPAFARAWAQLATAYAVMPLFALVPLDSTIGQSRAAVAQALKLDPSNAEAYTAQGITHLMSSEWREATPAFERAIALDSGYAFAHRGYTGVLTMTGRPDQMIAEGRYATSLDPLSPSAHVVATIVLLNAGRRDEALGAARRAVELDSSLGATARLAYALTTWHKGDAEGARRLLKGTVAVPQSAAWMGYLLGATGDRAGAAAFVKEMDRQRGRNAFVTIAQAWTYLGAGDTTRALDALERAMRAKEPITFTAPFGMPAYDLVRRSARFAAIVRGYGLDPARFGAGPQ